MRARLNDLLRNAIGRGVRASGIVFGRLMKRRLRTFECNQERLRRKYNKRDKTKTRDRRTEGRFAVTSGSAGDPKRVLFSRRRLRACKWTFSDMFARACRAFQIRRTSLYVFSSFEPDDSLTSLLLDEVDLPNYLATLQAPYRVQRHHAMRALAAEYGSTAVRLWFMTIANPGVLYSTNPSTISTFFDDLSQNWRRNSELIRHWRQHPKRFNADVRKIARRLASTGCHQRLQAIAGSDKPLPIDVWAPAVEAYICWTGGYVKPFLDRLQKCLPAPRYRLIPMYSMSTETIETVAHFEQDEVYFLPLAPGVVYEFIDHAAEPRLLTPTELETGKLYELIVTDAYGLRRYHTADLFLCRGKIHGLPDLIFQRRRGLAYSFTGEKLTAEQVTTVFAQLRERYPQVCADRFLTCVPSAETIPHYQVLLIGGAYQAQPQLDDIATHCDELLSAINCEYRSKRASGRLGPVTFIQSGTKEFAGTFAAAWESQFKFLPLCPHLIGGHSNRVS